MMTEIDKALALLSGVRNPLPAILDRIGLRHRPYVLRLRDGTGIELRPRAGDLFGFYETMLRRDYMASGQRLDAGATVIDVGANVGCFSLLAAKLVGPAGRVFAIEPDPQTYLQLLRNIELNRFDNVIPLQLAIGAERGKVTLHSAPNALFSSIYGSVNDQNVQGIDREVQMTTLHAFMEEHRIQQCDFMKLDCEGAEHDIIANMAAATARRIEQITMEVHKVPGHDGKTLKANLERLGYRLVSSAGLHSYRRVVDIGAIPAT